MMLELVPITVKAAQRLVRQWHRHLPTVQGGLFAAAVADHAERPRQLAIHPEPEHRWRRRLTAVNRRHEPEVSGPPILCDEQR